MTDLDRAKTFYEALGFTINPLFTDHNAACVVVEQEHAVEIANRAVDVMERENRIREEIRKGRPMSSVLELERWEQVR